jgi:threonine aldolase
MSRHIELRSDTFTKPTEPMLKAMFAAQVGDDVFGEDPTVNELEVFAAELFGMEAAVFCPSGTMTNQIAINVHTRPGEEVICEQGSHVYFYEAGGIARLSGCQARTIAGNRGQVFPEQIFPLINPEDVHRPRTRLVCLENTCNRGGGSTYSMENMHNIRALCDEHKLMLHLDGARLFNAIVANKENPKAYGSIFHSISVCLSKGLGAPVGSLLLGDKKFIHEARRARKALGGGMRQAGFLAAAGLFALKHHIDRLEEDHQKAKRLAAALSNTSWVKAVMPVETNIVIFEVAGEKPAFYWVDALKKKGIMTAATSPATIRMVTHLDVSDQDIAAVIEAIEQVN